MAENLIIHTGSKEEKYGYEVGAAGGVVYQNVGVTGYFDAVARIDVVAGENKVEVRFDDVLGEHDVIVVSTGRKFDETGHFGVRLLHDEIERLPVGGGGMAWVADGDLAGAVSNAGGLGIIGGGNAPKEVVKAH